jgi:hypothetical protein
MRARWLSLVAVGFGTCGPLAAQTYSLVEASPEGTVHRISIDTDATGTLQVVRDGKPTPIKVEAKNAHKFTEKVVATDRIGIRRAVRWYETAQARATVDGDRTERTLAPDHRLILAQRTGDDLSCYALAGPLTRPELEVVAEHFETLHLAGVLPPKAVAVGDTWKLGNSPAQSLCLFEGLIASELTAKLAAVNGRSALITVEGTAKGIENGAMATLAVNARVTFDLDARRIVQVEWKQRDTREQGPISPAAEIESTTILKREPVTTEPDELKARVPAEDSIPGAVRYLLHRDPKGRFQFLHDRDWHVVGQTDHHLVMRLLDRGDFVCQATVTPWKKAEAGKHVSADEFGKLVAEGWKMEQVLDRNEVPSDSDRWVYRIAARGELDGVAVSQTFYAVATANGDQMILTFTMKPANAPRLGTKDVALVNAIDFAKR